ncbi:MAG: bifunctional aldolase/short-chain dehydrogenase [Planctomycetota bacterium]|nr:MAG: bifunctional aldolase/short-chain dehydrogenase [Planctomycetota bacterium]
MDPILVERVRTSRLLGADSNFVLHGGGNTSAKGEVFDLLGRRLEILWVKGSGWDLGTIEAPGLPALDLCRLRELRELDSLTDEQMVREVRRCLLDPKAPTPSVETLLHAFLPHRFVDHSHADAILAISNCADGEAICHSIFGQRVAYLPFIMPGFPLAKAVADAVDANPSVEGVLLHHHGLFTFGESGEESLQRHFDLVALAAEHYQESLDASLAASAKATLTARDFTPELRGLLTELGDGTPFILETRAHPWLLAALENPNAKDICVTPPLTPDHALRTKNLPCWLASTDATSMGQALSNYAKDYRAYFERGQASRGDRVMLDPMPRVLLVPGYGMIGVGVNAKAAAIAADLAEHTLLTKTAMASLQPYQGLHELDLFDMEYWSLEQAKLGNKPRAELEGQVAAITGGGGAIGEGIARVLLDAGASVALLDLNLEAADAAAKRLGGSVLTCRADVTHESSMRNAMEQICARFGGIDILVPNAGVAHVATLAELTTEDWESVVAVNQTGVLHTLKVGADILKRQNLGGSIILVSSKNVAAPGASFGAYSASKAGAHQLAKVAALELAADDIAVNMVCPDAVFRHGDHPSGLWTTVGPDRARSRGLAESELEEFYRQRNLLQTEIAATDVGQAVLFFAARRTPTTGASLPVDGGVASAFPR